MYKNIGYIIFTMFIGFSIGYKYYEMKYNEFTEFVIAKDRQEKILSSINLLNSLHRDDVNQSIILVKNQLENALISTRSLHQKYLIQIEHEINISLKNSKAVKEIYSLEDDGLTLHQLVSAVGKQ